MSKSSCGEDFLQRSSTAAVSPNIAATVISRDRDREREIKSILTILSPMVIIHAPPLYNQI